MILSPIHCPTLVGRREQLGFLAERALAAAQGSGSVVLMEGDAGCGKTRLVTEFCRNLPAQGLRYAHGDCLEYAKQPFSPWIAVSRALLGFQPALTLTDVEREILSRLMPELGNGSVAAVESDKLQQFEALASFLKQAAAATPTIVVLEDLHWADAATIEFLRHVARVVADTALCIIATYRGDELTRNHPLRSVITRVERERSAWRIALEPLSDEEMQTFITKALTGHKQIAPEVALAIRRNAEGNPLFAEELLRSAVGSRKHVGARDLPHSLREAVTERLLQLSESDRNVIVSAAAVGRRFTPELVARITEIHVKDVVAALKHAVDLQLIGAEDASGAMEFRHELTRQAVYTELLATEAKPLHTKMAVAIEEMSDTASHIAELAYQWWSAGDSAKAALYNERAGDDAEAVYASQDAAVFFERALEAVDKDDPRRADLWRKLAWSLYRSGMGARAESSFDHSIATFLKLGNREEAAQTLIDLAHLCWTLADMPGHENATRRALGLIGDSVDSPVWFAARVQMAWVHALCGFEPEKALARLDEAERCRADVRSWDRVKFHECKALIYIMQGHESAALAETNEAAAAALASRDVANAVRCWGNVGLLAAQCGESELSKTAFDNVMELIDKRPPTGWTVPATHALHAHVQFLYGDLAGAANTIERALTAIIDVPSHDVLVACAAIPVGLAIDDRTLVDRCADESLIELAFRSRSGLVGEAARAFALFYLASDKPEDARRLLERALASLSSHPMPGDYEAMLVMVAEHCQEPHVSRARALLAQMSQVTGTKSAPAYLALFDALTAKRTGSVTLVLELATKAAALFETLHWPIYTARALEVAGKLREAAQIYRRIGAVGEVRRLEAIIAPPDTRGRRKNELSPREKEIASLVLAGKSNKEIAAQLVLSERTVENHLSSIFGKLEIRSRAQLAALLQASKAPIAKDNNRRI